MTDHFPLPIPGRASTGPDRLALIPGDGVGAAVVDAARQVLESLKPPERVGPDLEEIVASFAAAKENLLDRLRDVFRANMRLPLLIGLIIAVAQQATGINAIYFYAPTIFEQSGVGTNAAFAQATLIGVINVVFTIIDMLLIDRIGPIALIIHTRLSIFDSLVQKALLGLSDGT